jgi:dipeptidyl aminopeptidase/acylaminoacyl peptidase
LRPSLLAWADRKGSKQPINLPPKNYIDPRVSRDGERAVVEISGGRSSFGAGDFDVWIVDLTRGTSIRLTSEGSNIRPIWTPDGHRVTFMSRRAAKSGIYWAPADGSGKPELLLATETSATPTAWTPDGQTLFYNQLGTDGKEQTWMLPAPGRGRESQPRPFLESSFNESDMVSSPDGRWVAFDSNETGRYEIYVRPFPGPGGKTPISTQGGDFPRWHGREIFFRTLANELAVVEVQTSPTFHAGHQQILLGPIQTNRWDVAPDGKRVLLVENTDTPPEGGGLEAVVDWFEELRRRVPVSRK